MSSTTTSNLGELFDKEPFVSRNRYFDMERLASFLEITEGARQSFTMCVRVMPASQAEEGEVCFYDELGRDDAVDFDSQSWCLVRLDREHFRSDFAELMRRMHNIKEGRDSRTDEHGARTWYGYTHSMRLDHPPDLDQLWPE